MSLRSVTRTAEGIAAHVIAIVAGMALMLFAIGMGVTIMLIPIAVPLGVIGLGVFIWGVTRSRSERG